MNKSIYDVLTSKSKWIVLMNTFQILVFHRQHVVHSMHRRTKQDYLLDPERMDLAMIWKIPWGMPEMQKWNKYITKNRAMRRKKNNILLTATQRFVQPQSLGLIRNGRQPLSPEHYIFRLIEMKEFDWIDRNSEELNVEISWCIKMRMNQSKKNCNINANQTNLIRWIEYSIWNSRFIRTIGLQSLLRQARMTWWMSAMNSLYPLSPAI